MPLPVWAVGALFVGLALGAVLRRRDAWPFSHYPMFCQRLAPEDLAVVRIAIEDEAGRIDWWRPRFFRLPDRLCARFEALRRVTPARGQSPALLEFFSQTQHLIVAENPAATGRTAVLFVCRRVEWRDGAFVSRDEVVARIPFPGERMAVQRAVGR
jgi:hypothetical protein